MFVDRHRLHSVQWFLSGMLTAAILTALINHYNPQNFMARNSYFRKDSDIETKLIHQRNSVSEILNIQQQKIGVLQCEMKDHVHERGGYCMKAAMALKPMIKNSWPLRDVVNRFSLHIKGKTVASFGEGPGAYRKLMISSGHLSSVDSYDGSPYCNESSDGEVQFLDLSVPQFGLPVYDWIVSIEVAEHIPANYEHIYLDNIARHAREGVLISWAVPGQTGLSHVNCRLFSYVRDRMRELGFEHDEKTSIKIKQSAPIILKKNLNVFVRNSPDQTIGIFS